MRFFSKRQGPTTVVSPINGFWSWWAAEGRMLDPTTESRATDQLNRLVTSIHPDLTWHFGPGRSGSQHCLTVSAGGVAEVRPAAERWLRASPKADHTWEFRASQERDAGALVGMLDIAGCKLDLSEASFSIDVDEEALRVHVGVYHPAFPVLQEQAQLQVSFLLLDWLVGEDDVERWIGRIHPQGSPPSRASRADEVLAAVDELAASREPGVWTLAQFEDRDGHPGLASFQRGLRWIDHPTLDRHQIVTAPYSPQENGLPFDGTVLESLRAIEAELEATLGHRGVLVAHESSRGVRTFHAYTDGEDQNADVLIAEWARRHDVTVHAEPDPAWSQVRQFTG